MDFALPCQCGNVLRISAIDAGRRRSCSCGVSYQLPPMVELRRLEAAGETAIPANLISRAGCQPPPPEPIHTAAQKLKILDQSGRLPLEYQCMECNAATRHALECFIECELPEERPREPLLMYIVIALLFPMFALYRYLIDREDPVIVGEEVVVRAPLRLCPDCADLLRRRPGLVREKLQQMPLYQPLFQDYPEAVIKISEQR